MKEFFARLFRDKKVLILGFGREGQSTYKLIREYFPQMNLTIADKRSDVAGQISKTDNFISFNLGEGYMQGLEAFELIIKTPGISLQELPDLMLTGKITSQTDLFLRAYASQVIGVTGTKGKSTTTSLIHHILTSAGRKAVLVGNIGLPPFEIVPQLDESTIIVFELSSHQLEFLTRAPHISILLNLFQEHLDHYSSLEAYHRAKWNIAVAQKEEDYFIYNAENPGIQSWLIKEKPLSHLLPYSSDKSKAKGIFLNNEGVIQINLLGFISNLFNKDIPRYIPGDHNLMNAMAAAAACRIVGVKEQDISKGISSFKGLPHRIEYVGIYDGVRYYNDSIATIPEATIEAIKTLGDIDTLILGGFDRGLDYNPLVDYLAHTSISNLIFIGEVGRRIYKELTEKKFEIKMFVAIDYQQVIEIARLHTAKGKICLLSPAAASYDMFRNFEERGEVYKKIVKG
jgi:UDP-N-acetylmuramoyl-L-alanine---L-glutamate ligase